VLALGTFDSLSWKAALGIDFSGVVRRVGSQVEDLEVGDRFFGISDSGAFTSTIHISYSLVSCSLARKIPDDLSFVDAATMECCFETVFRSIIDIEQMESGQVT